MLSLHHYCRFRTSPGSRRALTAAGLLAFAAAGQMSPALADGRSGQAQGEAIATVARPIAVSGIADLDFGMVASSGAGTVTVPVGGGPASFGGKAREACTGQSACPAPHPAQFAVSGEPSRNYRIALPDRIGISHPASSQDGLFVTRFTVRTASRPASGSRGELSREGHDSFEVGGTLEISGTLPPGRYAVPVPVSVTYD